LPVAAGGSGKGGGFDADLGRATRLNRQVRDELMKYENAAVLVLQKMHTNHPAGMKGVHTILATWCVLWFTIELLDEFDEDGLIGPHEKSLCSGWAHARIHAIKQSHIPFHL
jgi:hypothetical protein